ncbi:FAD binding domain-containing protein [Arthrobacter sp. H5]|uniref:FAD binding domain-containing protein n=1 Tax=Arthrobacter sp. H5 TaxID=1267973 RepID=UPI0004B5BC98|nr:FAD binding domain-containing protein [Arthrobacter sp. H5]
MDLNTVTVLRPTADPSEWQPGDAWLAGGTVLFSYDSSTLKRLLDITHAGWPPLTINERGLEIAATCTIAELYAFTHEAWPAVALFQQCADSFVASFKIWNMSTVGGNIATALPAGPMTSLTAALEGTAVVLSPDGSERTLPVADLVIGDGATSLREGELLRAIRLPAAALQSRTAFRRLSLSNLGRSGVLLIGRTTTLGGLVITVTASTTRPVQLRFSSAPTQDELAQSLDGAIPTDLYHNDIHGLPQWRRDMTYRLAEEIRLELRT